MTEIMKGKFLISLYLLEVTVVFSALHQTNRDAGRLLSTA